MQGKTLVIVNPSSKHGQGAAAAKQVCNILAESLGQDAFDLLSTVGVGHATSLAKQACGQYERVVSIGGDGTIHEIANGLMTAPLQQRPTLGVVPVGSGNDYAQTLGISDDIETAVHQLLQARPCMLDVGQVNGEYFVETVSFGLDAAIAHATVELRKRTNKTGIGLYFEAGIDQLLHHLDEHHVHAMLDDAHEFEASIVTFAVQVGPTYGGGFRICPDAVPDDGMFDICYAQAPWSVPRAVFVFAQARNGKHVNARGIMFERASKLELHFDEAPPAQADGERIGGSSFSISMHPQALSVLVP